MSSDSWQLSSLILTSLLGTNMWMTPDLIITKKFNSESQKIFSERPCNFLHLRRSYWFTDHFSFLEHVILLVSWIYNLYKIWTWGEITILTIRIYRANVRCIITNTLYQQPNTAGQFWCGRDVVAQGQVYNVTHLGKNADQRFVYIYSI